MTQMGKYPNWIHKWEHLTPKNLCQFFFLPSVIYSEITQIK